MNTWIDFAVHEARIRLEEKKNDFRGKGFALNVPYIPPQEFPQLIERALDTKKLALKLFDSLLDPYVGNSKQQVFFALKILINCRIR